MWRPAGGADPRPEATAADRLRLALALIVAAGAVLGYGLDAAVTVPDVWLRIAYASVVVLTAVGLWTRGSWSIVAVVRALLPARWLDPSSARSNAAGVVFAVLYAALMAGLLWGEVQAFEERHAPAASQPR